MRFQDRALDPFRGNILVLVFGGDPKKWWFSTGFPLKPPIRGTLKKRHPHVDSQPFEAARSIVACSCELVVK